MINEELIELNCKICNEKIFGKAIYKYRYDRNGKICAKCLSKKSSEVLRKIRSQQTSEERSKFAKFARSLVKDSSAAVRKQWQTIKSDDKLFKKICEARKYRMQKVWQNYSPKRRNRIIRLLAGGNNCGRSKLSEFFKNNLIKNNLYDGFVSEQVFHGFIPDEINHKLKIIIEVFGDIYHCNPRKYKNENEFLSFIGRTVGEQWKRDRIKLACYYKHGYTVIIVWEADIYNNIEKEIERVRNEINKKTVIV